MAMAQLHSYNIHLIDPHLNSELKCGLGGLAAAICSLKESPEESDQLLWKSYNVNATIYPNKIQFTYENLSDFEKFLDKFLHKALDISQKNHIILPGTAVREKLHNLEWITKHNQALRVTFLQHNKSVDEEKTQTDKTIKIDSDEHNHKKISYRKIKNFTHRKLIRKIIQAIISDINGKPVPIVLTGTVLPGATERFYKTKAEYNNYTFSPKQALCALFLMTGSLQFLCGENGFNSEYRSGIILIIEPNNLEEFATYRPHLSPKNPDDFKAIGSEDGLIKLCSEIYHNNLQSYNFITRIKTLFLKKHQWNSKQNTISKVINDYKLNEQEITYIVEKISEINKYFSEDKNKINDNDKIFFRKIISYNLINHREWYDSFFNQLFSLFKKNKNKENSYTAMIHFLENNSKLLYHLINKDSSIVEKKNILFLTNILKNVSYMIRKEENDNTIRKILFRLLKYRHSPSYFVNFLMNECIIRYKPCMFLLRNEEKITFYNMLVQKQKNSNLYDFIILCFVSFFYNSSIIKTEILDVSSYNS